MKTKQITYGAMVCAGYGVLLLLNQQFALGIESTLPWIFSIPCLVYTAKYGVSQGAVVTLSMALMTLLFGQFTTWFYSWSALITGWAYGAGLYKRLSYVFNFIICFILSFITQVCIFFLWASIFDLSIESELASLVSMFPFLHIDVIFWIFLLFMGLLQALVIHLIAIVLCRRLRIELRKMKPFVMIKSPRWLGIASIVVVAGFFFCQNVVECSKDIEGLIQFVFMIDMMALLFYGVLFMTHYCLIKNKQKYAFFAIVGAFVPFVQILWIIAGFIDCTWQVRERF